MDGYAGWAKLVILAEPMFAPEPYAVPSPARKQIDLHHRQQVVSPPPPSQLASSATSEMKTPKFEPSTLSNVLDSRYTHPHAPGGAQKRVLLELEGDAALARQKYEEALASYKAAKGASWRLKAKMGYCAYHLDQHSEAALLLDEAPQHKDSIALIVLIDSLAQDGSKAVENRERIRGLIAVLMGGLTLYPYAFDLVDRHVLNYKERLKYFEAGVGLFPSDANIRRNYLRALWHSGTGDRDQLINLANQCSAAQDAEPQDLWLASQILADQRLPSPALDLLRRLRDTCNGGDLQAMSLVEADTTLLAKDYEAAKEMYRSIYVPCAEAGTAFPEVAMAAARGLFIAGMVTGDETCMNEGAAGLERVFRGYGPFALQAHGHPFLREPISLTVGGRAEWYFEYADLSAVSLDVMRSLKDPDTRALFEVLYATQEEPSSEISQSTATEIILAAGKASQNKLIGHTVALTLMKTGQYKEAGRAFARLEWGRAVELPGCIVVDDNSDMFDKHGCDQPSVVDAFADGMIEEFNTSSAGNGDFFASDLQEILSSYLRRALITHKLHDRFFAMARSVMEMYKIAGQSPSADAQFDFGLASHYKGLKAQAAQAYKACLALEPDNQAARENLAMVLPPTELKAAAIETEIRSSRRQSKVTRAADLSLRQAVYLIALYRACGGAEQDWVLRPFGENEHPFSPTLETRQPLVTLLSEGLIWISEESPADAFVVDASASKVTAYMLHKMYWEVPASTLTLIREIQELCLASELPPSWQGQAPALVADLARAECLAYLKESADERKFPMPSGEKTMLMIDNLLSTFSVAQSYAIFWQGAAAAADFKQRENVTAAHAGNTIVGNCQRRADRARAEGWSIKPFARPRSVRRSELSYTLHDAFLGVGERAFTTPIGDLFAVEYGAA